MIKKFATRSVYGIFLFSLVSCNIYGPFQPANTQEDYLELAIKCEDKGDISCAIDNYNKLADGELKNQKLCISYLSKVGITIDILVNKVNKSKNGQLLGALANALLPWSTTQESDAVTSVQVCSNYVNTATDPKLATLLRALATLTDCAVRIGKTDVYVGNSLTDTTCNTPGNGDGKIVAADIEGTSTYMCATDVNACIIDIASLTAADFDGKLNDSGLTAISQALQALPAELKNTSTATNTGRDAIKTTVPAN